MSTLGRFLVYLFIATCVILMAVILGDSAPWYFAWLVGSVMMVLISAAGAALLDTQEAEQRHARGHRESGDAGVRST